MFGNGILQVLSFVSNTLLNLEATLLTHNPLPPRRIDQSSIEIQSVIISLLHEGSRYNLFNRLRGAF